MESDQSNLEKLYERLTMEDEADEGIVVCNGEVQDKKETFVLVGRFLTEKNINFQVMQNVLASVWRPKEGMEIHDIGGFRFSFVFYHIMDLRKVLEGGPWSFEQNTLVYKQVNKEEDPHLVSLKEVDIWVQVHDIPKGFISENILKSVGDYIGKFIKTEPASFDGGWKQFVRIRVTIDIQKPLRRRMKIKREGGSWSWLNFKFERLGTFCFVCGILGHTDRECPIIYANPEAEVERAYGVWLRAPSRNVKNNTGARWLRNAEGGSSWAGNGGGWRQQSTEGGSNLEMTRFTERDGVVREIRGDRGAVTILSRDEGDIDKDGDNSNLNGMPDKENIILEAKRRRKDTDRVILGPGLENMQLDGPQETTEDEQHVVGIPKNLQRAGSGLQTRRGL